VPQTPNHLPDTASAKTTMGLETYGKVRVVTLERFKQASDGRLKHAFCTRLGGVSQGPFRSLNFDAQGGDSRENVSQNKRILAEALELDPERIFLANQVHGDQVLILEEDPLNAGSKYHHLDYDAILTRQRGVAIGVLTADCLPILIYDPKEAVIGIVHAGWRGTCLNVVGTVIAKLQKVFNVDPQGLLVGLGPCIGNCCYEVDIKVVRSIKNSTARWKEFIKPVRANKYTFDLVGLNVHQLLQAGVPQGNIVRVNACTACNSKVFFSHRASKGKTGRQLNLIQLLD
jgi:YfiH family protein